ncbi:hypothetical protein ACX80O_12025 [Arthrobacter sp. Hz1]
MTHRNRLLTFGTCTALMAGSAFLSAAPAAAQTNPTTCVSVQVALGSALDSASVDIELAYQLKAAIAAIEAAGLAFSEALEAADLAAAEEYAAFDEAIQAYEAAAMAVEGTQAALDAAQTVKILADDRVEAAELALAAVVDGDDAGRVAAEAELAAALVAQADVTTALTVRQTERDAAPAALAAADAILMEAQIALDAVLYTEAVSTAEDNYFSAVEAAEATLAALGGTGTSIEEVQTLVDAVVTACAAPGGDDGAGPSVAAPVVVVTPSAPTAPAPAAVAVTKRGLNVQTAAGDTAGARDDSLALGGAAGGALLLLSGAAVWLRRSARG